MAAQGVTQFECFLPRSFLLCFPSQPCVALCFLNVRSEVGKNPAFQFYPNDWALDLQEHPLEIEGAWIRIICKLWWSETKGIATKPLTVWSKILGTHHNKALVILRYISSNNIGLVQFLDNQNITIISRRMVKDEKIRQIRREVGKLGGNPSLKSTPSDLVNQSVNQNPTPSSSSSSPTTVIKEKEEKIIPDKPCSGSNPGVVPEDDRPTPDKPPGVNRKRSFTSAEVTLTDYYRSYASKHGHDNGSCDLLFDEFKDYCLANNKTYLDWDAAWRNWVRNDKKFGKKGKNENIPGVWR